MPVKSKTIIKQQGRYDESLPDQDFRRLVFKEIKNILKTLNNIPAAEFDQKSKSILLNISSSGSARTISVGGESIIIYSFNSGSIGNTINMCDIPANTLLKSIIIKVSTAFDAGNALSISDNSIELVKAGNVDLTLKDEPVEIPIWKPYNNLDQLIVTFSGTPSAGAGEIIAVFSGFTRL